MNESNTKKLLEKWSSNVTNINIFEFMMNEKVKVYKNKYPII